MIYLDRDYRTTDIYTAEGKLVGTCDYIEAYPQSGMAFQYTAENIYIYDKDFKLAGTLVRSDNNGKYLPVEGTDKMLIHEYVKNGTRTCCITDLSGKALTEAYEDIISVKPDKYLYVSEYGGENSRVVDFEGNVLISGRSSYKEPGYFHVYVENEGYYVYDCTGHQINDVAMLEEGNGLVFKNDKGEVLILSTGEMLPAAGYVKYLSGSLVLIKSTIYDVISGKTVLTDVDACVATGGNLYVWENDKGCYTRYIAEFKNEAE